MGDGPATGRAHKEALRSSKPAKTKSESSYKKPAKKKPAKKK
jgi:hypothetical protein